MLFATTAEIGTTCAALTTSSVTTEDIRITSTHKTTLSVPKTSEEKTTTEESHSTTGTYPATTSSTSTAAPQGGGTTEMPTTLALTTMHQNTPNTSQLQTVIPETVSIINDHLDNNCIYHVVKVIILLMEISEHRERSVILPQERDEEGPSYNLTIKLVEYLSALSWDLSWV